MQLKIYETRLRIKIVLILMLSLFLTDQDSKGLQPMKERQWGEKKEGLAISIVVSEADYKKSDDIVLDILLKNFGANPVPLVVRSQWIDYTYVVSNSLGQHTMKNAFGRQREEAGQEGRKMIVDLRPGESRSDEFELSKAFDLKPGTYTVFVARTFQNSSHAGQLVTVRSNLITFRVVE